VWSRNAASDTGMKTPQWGFASSPLVVDDAVIVAAAGQLAAYDLATGARAGSAPTRRELQFAAAVHHRRSPAGPAVERSRRLTSVALADGTLLWEHPWPGYPIVQPALTADGDILISVSDSSGTRRLAVAHGPAGWTAAERWTSNGLKPYFNDFVVHHGYAFGFDGSILACIDLKDGKRKWKGGRYGNGQLVLLPDQDLLLVLSEEGELALVGATPDQFTELARFPAIEGKTWNHPVLAGDVLLVRNGQEMAAFRMSAPRTSFMPALGAARRQIVGGGNLSIGIGGHGKLSGAIIRVCREQIESRDAVGRYTNDGGAGRIEFFFLLRECMSFKIAALGIGGGIEIDDDRPFLQRFRQ
jgi:outer membrane protein assembly factor BamB